MFRFFKHLWRQFKTDYAAARRGEVRVAPGYRGRVFAKAAPGGGAVRAGRVARMTVSTRVYCAAEDHWYTPAEYRAKFTP